MAAFAMPLIRFAVGELGPHLVRAAAATAGAFVAWKAGTDSGTASREDATPLSLPLTRPCKDCPPGQTGRPVRRPGSMPQISREYQGRVTGRPYSLKPPWSEEWNWANVDFDGFQPGDCLMQEAKARYDQFVLADGKAVRFFEGFDKMRAQMERQATAVHAHPPTRLLWYFMTPRARQYMLPYLTRYRVPSVLAP